MVDFVLTLHFGRLMGVLFPDLKAEAELAVPVEALVREDLELEAEKIIRIRELCLARLGQLQFVNVLSYSQLCSTGLLPGAGSATSFTNILISPVLTECQSKSYFC